MTSSLNESRSLSPSPQKSVQKASGRQNSGNPSTSRMTSSLNESRSLSPSPQISKQKASGKQKSGNPSTSRMTSSSNDCRSLCQSPQKKSARKSLNLDGSFTTRNSASQIRSTERQPLAKENVEAVTGKYICLLCHDYLKSRNCHCFRLSKMLQTFTLALIFWHCLFK